MFNQNLFHCPYGYTYYQLNLFSVPNTFTKRNHTNRMQLDSSYQIIRQLGTNLFMIHS